METKNRNKNGTAFSIIWGLFLIAIIVGCSKSDPSPDPLPNPEPIPTITGIDPTFGPIGTEVTINGTNFSGTASENVISFNGIMSAATSTSSTQLKAMVPPNATSGVVSVTVKGKQAQGPTFTIFEGNAFNCTNKEILEDTLWEDKGQCIAYDRTGGRYRI